MLDVAIGVVFVFLLISLICSAINELIEAKLKLRAVDLEQGVRQLLNETTDTTLTQKLYDHPLIFSLFKGNYTPATEMRKSDDPAKVRYSRGSNLPSYIPAKNFSVALMDILLPATAGGAGAPAVGAALPAGGAAAAEVAAAARAGGAAPPAPAPADGLATFRTAVGQIQNNEKLKQALLSIINAAGNDINKTRDGIETWFNSTMDRVSGWYKRRVQTIMFLMGLGLAILLNADTIAIFRNLANERPLRDAIVAAAKDYKGPSDSSSDNDKIRQNVGTLQQMGLPMGWGWRSTLNVDTLAATNYKAVPRFDAKDAGQFWRSVGIWALKAFGWFITAMAVSLGAPFWFDILNKIMVVRSTVKPHEKSPEEGSQDKR